MFEVLELLHTINFITQLIKAHKCNNTIFFTYSHLLGKQQLQQ